MTSTQFTCKQRLLFCWFKNNYFQFYSVLTLLFCLLFQTNAYTQHVLGVKNSYNINSLSSLPSQNTTSVSSLLNPGIFYKFYHKKIFAIQTEFSFIKQAYAIELDTARKITPSSHQIKAVELPVMALVYLPLKNLRPYITGGFMLGYILDRTDEVAGVYTAYPFDEHDRRFQFGVSIGGGIAYTVNHFDFHVATLYSYNLSFLRDPIIPNQNNKYINLNKLGISFGIGYLF